MEITNHSLGCGPGLLRYIFQSVQEGFLVKYHFLISIAWCYLVAHFYIQVTYQLMGVQLS